MHRRVPTASSAALRDVNASSCDGRPPLAQRPADQLEQRVQRAHVCFALFRGVRLRRPRRTTW